MKRVNLRNAEPFNSATTIKLGSARDSSLTFSALRKAASYTTFCAIFVERPEINTFNKTIGSKLLTKS